MFTRIPLAEINPTHFKWEFEDGIGIVTMNRPERKNPLTFQSYAELRDLFHTLKYVPEVKVVVFTGAEGNFSSGGDVHDIIGPLTEMKIVEVLEFARMTGDLVKEMRACPQPIIAAVDGVSAGAGAIIPMACDFRYGTARSKTAFLFTRVGLAGCDMGACAILPRIVGQGRAAELLYTGRSLGGEEGERWGYFNALVEPEALMDHVMEVARRLIAGPTFAHGMTKRMLEQEWAMGIAEAIESEAQAQTICMYTEDFRRAYEAFAAKRKPVFAGD
jgi:enoyl-CoA hydratase/carnithine racemase